MFEPSLKIVDSSDWSQFLYLAKNYVNARYQMFVEQAPYGFFETDLGGSFTFFNYARVYKNIPWEVYSWRYLFLSYLIPDNPLTSICPD